MLRPLALGLLVAAAVGCASNRTDFAPPVVAAPADGKAAPDTLRLALGESADVLGLALRFAAVEEDSRCPAHTTCVWQGRARVQLLADDEPLTLTLDSGDAEAADARAHVAGLRVTLASLDPYPGTDETGRPPVATLVVAP